MAKILLAWLTQDCNSPKHSTSWKHPIVAWFLHCIISSATIVIFHDTILLRNLEIDPKEIPPLGTLSLCQVQPHLRITKSEWVARFCFLYAIALLTIRLLSNRPGIHRYSILYELTWLCNSALLFGGSFGLFTCRPNVATGFAVAVSIDQLLWYVDALGYAINRITLSAEKRQKKEKMFPIGVCQYLVWEQTQWSTKITCTHHFWTIPLLIYGANGLDWGAYFMNAVTVASYVLLSRWLTPFGLDSHPVSSQSQNEDCKETKIIGLPKFEKYMNVNLSHELWQDIRIGILRRQADNQATMVYLYRLIVWWQMLNFFCFLFLRQLTGAFQLSSVRAEL